MQSQAILSVGDEQQETIGLTLHLSTMSDREQITLTSNLCVLTRTYKAGSWVLETLKARLIFESKERLEQSCCHLLAWLCTYILTPLLEVIPCHLKSIYDHLERLSHLTSQQIAGRKFNSGDISSLYTNINIQSCIDDVISLASEYQRSLCLYGLKLSDIQEMLEVILGDSFFTYNSRVFRQLIGLFMGCKPSPICGIVRVYTFERRTYRPRMCESISCVIEMLTI